MSARLLYSMSEENSNLQKQKGCIKGLRQVFESNNILMGRSISSRNQKRIQSGRGNDEGSKFSNPIPKAKEEKERSSPKFSRDSTSSSSSCTASTLDRSQRVKQEPSASSTDAPKLSIQGRRSLSKAATEEQAGRKMKHIDSPRPRSTSTPLKDRVSGLYGSYNTNSACRDLPPIYNEKRNTTQVSATKDPPRLSLDEGESWGRSKSRQKFESPRLSLDSRRQVLTRSNSGRNSDLVSSDLQVERIHYRRDTDLQQEHGSQQPISNVVAKLMGLEALPAFIKGQNQQEERNIGNYMAYSNSPRVKTTNSTTKRLNSRTSTDLVVRKPWEEHNVTEKPAPKHHKEDKDPQNLSVSLYGEIEKRLSELDFQKSGTDLRALKQILEAMERTTLNRDVKQRAQTLDKDTHMSNGESKYMSSHQGSTGLRCTNRQDLYDDCKMPTITKGLWLTGDNLPRLETRPDKLVPSLAKSRTSVVQDEALQHLPNLRRLRNQQQVDGKQEQEKKHTTKILAKNPHFQNPMPQSVDVVENSSRVQKATLEKLRRLPKHMTKGELRSLNKSTLTVRNLKLENQRNFQVSPSDPIMIKMKNTQVESGFSSRSIKSKASTGSNPPSKTSIGSTWQTRQGKSASQLTERDIIMVKAIETAVENQARMQNGTLLHAEEREDSMHIATLKISTAVQEQPSPVSVLDAAFYGDEPLSPIKKKLVYYRDNETPTLTDAMRQAARIHHLSDNPGHSFGYENDNTQYETLKHIDNKHWRHSILSLGWDINAEGRYLFEILLASGFMRGGNFNLSDRFFTRTQAINPKLFWVMEQTRSIFPSVVGSARSIGNVTSRLEDKAERRLVFDVANEILVQKSYLADCFSKLSPLHKKKTEGSFISGSQILRELSTEIDNLQAKSSKKRFDNEDDFIGNLMQKDLKNESGVWAVPSGEVQGLVSDIERLIFKDLVVELLDDKTVSASALKGHGGSLCSANARNSQGWIFHQV